ncbi:MAG: hypothetical protein MR697_09670 [Clostridiales bacterium]|nr:hypothetical protein [Clostridiales bacterium]
MADMNLTSAIPGMDCSAGRRKGRVGRLIAAGIFAAALLGLLVLTLADLRRAASPIVFPVEDGVYNLTAEALVTTPEEAGGYVLYTNSTKFGVTIVSDAEQSGTVTLVDAATGDGIRYATVSGRSAACEFTALSAARRYRVDCEGFSPDAVVTISDARTISFWHGLRAVLGELLSLPAGS